MFVIGVCLALWVHVSPYIGAGLLLPVLGLLFINKIYILPVIAFVAAIVGIAYGSLHLMGRDRYMPFIGKDATIRGRIKEDIGHSSSGSLSVQLDTVSIDEVVLPGSILVSGRSVGDALRGDTIEIQGKIREGFGSFPASVTMNKLVSIERQKFGDMGRIVRDAFADKIRAVIPEPQASLGIGFLTGQKSALPSDLADALKIAGLTHIVVASGYNLTILVRLARKLLLKLSKYLSAVSSSAMIVAFVAITGLSPSMTRAGLVSGMSLLSWYYGHAFHPFVLLPLAAAITVAIQPSYVWGDMGWQLSFSAFMGVMIVGPLLQTYFFGNKEPGMFRQILGETIAAHIVTVPIIAASFGTISNVAIVANILVVPLVPLAMLLTFICGMGVIFSLPLIDWIATPTSWLLGYMTNVATYVAELPWAQGQLSFAPIVWAGYAAGVCLACFWMWRKTHYSFRDSQALLC
ncbi:MAG: ComEC/Rec2 family competence protein [Candidatus Saccharimonadaceae bacterium]